MRILGTAVLCSVSYEHQKQAAFGREGLHTCFGSVYRQATSVDIPFHSCRLPSLDVDDLQQTYRLWGVNCQQVIKPS